MTRREGRSIAARRGDEARTRETARVNYKDGDGVAREGCAKQGLRFESSTSTSTSTSSSDEAMMTKGWDRATTREVVVGRRSPTSSTTQSLSEESGRAVTEGRKRRIDAASATRLRLAARCLACALVFLAWQITQSVCAFSTAHVPPPSKTAIL